ncbi:MAG: hypothetical protein SVP26_09920 [Chloroflexota bacterium]|nr:hypothetical protein [Chloroflexota bacterium]
MNDLETLRKRWLAERPVYRDLCERVKGILETEVRRRGVPCILQASPKEVASFLKKALRKGYSNPYEEIRDKAGVRVVCTYYDSLVDLEGVVRDCFVVHSHENKTLGLEYDQLGYLGIHFEVSLPEGMLEPDDKHRGLICEIQLHTRAQNLWADISHELSYKPSQPPPTEVKRSIYRLVALVEIFDDAVAEARKEMLSRPAFQEARMLEQLDRHFYRFTAKPYDRELSLGMLSGLQTLLSEDEVSGFGPLLDRFTEQNQEKLEEIFSQYADDERCNPLLFQPETLLVFERLEKDVFRLKEIWGDLLPLDLLESLATIWGKSVSTND